MKSLLLLGLLSFAWLGGTGRCHARIGETYDQCVARYGEPINSQKTGAAGIGSGFTGFKKNGYLIAVIFFKDVVSYEFYCKADNSDLSQDEKETLLTAESNGLQWTKDQSSDAFQVVWRRSDGTLASDKAGSPMLSFTSPDFLAALNAKSKSDTQAKLKDF